MTAGPLARFTVLDLTRVRAGPTAVRYFVTRDMVRPESVSVFSDSAATATLSCIAATCSISRSGHKMLPEHLDCMGAKQNGWKTHYY